MVRRHSLGRSQVLVHLAMIGVFILTLYPAVTMLVFSFKSSQQWLFSRWTLTFPLRLQNYSIAWDGMWRYIVNTIFVSTVGVAGMLILSSLSAFVFARMRFPGKEQIYFAILMLLMIPGVLSLVPQYILYQQLGLLNTYGALILPIITGGSVFGVFLLRTFFGSLPEELFEAARIDGCSLLGLYWRICIPLSYPILGTLAIMQLIGTWNDYIWPLTAVSDQNIQVVTVGLVKLTTQLSNNLTGDSAHAYGPLFASYTLAALPILILFAFTSKYYIQGLVSSGLKL
jgi:ABC-type glycerol-3-phosphate transport system permease component